ncbi:BMP family lipoprotein [Isobaculum melis]|uniref:Nucleoside-binding protein n=1 Tax=Isobaculum melis TaxID=142588 RepID=A0A1H9UK42_9LACT|nr:BMP family protein [Isobaculum melis]SES09910.1 nucleoside-binding protein [Isobaculum melis]
MKKRSLIGLLALGVGVSMTLVACGGNKDKDSSKDKGGSDSKYAAAIVTDVGGVDDKSFNQSAWEGLQEWGKENDLERGKGGFDYFQSNTDADYMNNLNNAVKQGYTTVFGVGYKLTDAISEVAGQRQDTNFVIIDSVVEDRDNVASVLFKDQEASFLAGIAAAKTSESKKIGFVGGMEGEVIGRFEAGFLAGVKAVDPSIKVDVVYAEAFDAPEKGQQIAAAMYNNGVDVIFHASGATGNGVFSEAKDIMKNDPSKKVWVIGVDRDQEEEGKYDGGNVTLTSTLKGVGATVKDIANRSKDGKFPGGEVISYGLKEEAIDLTEGNLTEDVQKAVDEYREKIISGDIEVPDKP